MVQYRQETMVREYTSTDDYNRDARKLASQGWVVQDVTVRQPSTGCLRGCALGGIGALIWRPKPRTVVTYGRSVPT